jgi:hypothetical protein
MNLDELTIGQAKELIKQFGYLLNPPSAPDSAAKAYPWEIGKNYLIRTVTMIQTGRLVAVTKQELVLEDAAWIADTGRFADSLKSGNFNEVEPFPSGKVIIGRGSIVDAISVNFELPRIQK